LMSRPRGQNAGITSPNVQEYYARDHFGKVLDSRRQARVDWSKSIGGADHLAQFFVQVVHLLESNRGYVLDVEPDRPSGVEIPLAVKGAVTTSVGDGTTEIFKSRSSHNTAVWATDELLYLLEPWVENPRGRCNWAFDLRRREHCPCCVRLHQPISMAV
jgi:hypothetical protein